MIVFALTLSFRYWQCATRSITSHCTGSTEYCEDLDHVNLEMRSCITRSSFYKRACVPSRNNSLGIYELGVLQNVIFMHQHPEYEMEHMLSLSAPSG